MDHNHKYSGVVHRNKAWSATRERSAAPLTLVITLLIVAAAITCQLLATNALTQMGM